MNRKQTLKLLIIAAIATILTCQIINGFSMDKLNKDLDRCQRQMQQIQAESKVLQDRMRADGILKDKPVVLNFEKRQ